MGEEDLPNQGEWASIAFVGGRTAGGAIRTTGKCSGGREFEKGVNLTASFDDEETSKDVASRKGEWREGTHPRWEGVG